MSYNVNKRICLISNCWGDAHQMNKILEFEKNEINVKILAYVREDYYDSEFKRDFVKISNIQHRNYIKRIWKYFLSVFKILKNIKNEKLVYVYGIDNIIIVILLKILLNLKFNLIYEIPDIREIQFGNSVFTKILKKTEKILYKKIDLFVLTSKAYYTNFYSKILDYPINFTVIENKINASIINKLKATDLQHSPSSNYNLSIGYFGLLRCSQTLKILIELAKKRNDYNVVLRGIFMSNTNHLKKEIDCLKNINYLGPYVSPTDLNEMYNEIDISWICYPYSDKSYGNWQLAQTNRFYESGFFKVPMISSKGTLDSIKVCKYNIGLVLDLSNLDKCVDKIGSITSNDIENWKKNIESLNKENFVIDSDYNKLINFVKNCIK